MENWRLWLHFGFILGGSRAHFGSQRAPKNQAESLVFFRVSRGGSRVCPSGARDGPGPPAGLPRPAFSLFGGTRDEAPPLGNLAKTEPGGIIQMVFLVRTQVAVPSFSVGPVKDPYKGSLVPLAEGL